MLLPTAIVSIGEDATCRVWNYSGETLNTFRGHRGKSIWSMAVDRKNETLVSYFRLHVLVLELVVISLQATGGGDCSIRVQSLKEPSRPSVCHSWQPCRRDGDSVTPTPRSVFLLGQTAICLTDQGYKVLLILCWVSHVNFFIMGPFRNFHFPGPCLLVSGMLLGQMKWCGQKSCMILNSRDIRLEHSLRMVPKFLSLGTSMAP